MDWSTVLQPQATLLAALCGLAGVVFGWFVNALVQSRTERAKVANARADTLAKEISTAVQQLTIHAAAALHSMSWLTWLAEKRPGQFTKERLETYNTELHQVLPKVSGYLSTIAAFDPPLYAELHAHVKKLYDLDEYLGRTGLAFEIQPTETTRSLGAKFDEVQKMERGLGETMANVLRTRIRPAA